eukprot:sb/3479152/
MRCDREWLVEYFSMPLFRCYKSVWLLTPTETTTNQNSLFRSRYWLSANQGPINHFRRVVPLFIFTSAPIGCASSKGFLITHPASPGGFYRPFQRQ